MAKRVLVVDDDLGMRETLAAALELDGYETTLAADGLAALDLIGSELPALIILDLMMPRMDGFAFAEALTARGLRERVPLLVLTADGRAREKAARIGAEGWLAKPFALADLLERVAALAGPT
jgi:two-component system response regulator MprA